MKTMKNIKFRLVLKVFVLFTVMFTLNGCKNIHETPDGAVVAFIIAAEQRDMTKAWNILSPELQAHYNSLGEKMRKSGRGALENEIARITKFKKVKKDYTISVDPANGEVIKIVMNSGPEYKIETVKTDNDYKIKNSASMKNLLEGIAAEITNKEVY